MNDSLHTDLIIRRNEFFVQNGQANYRIGKIIEGVLRGFTVNNDGDEITTHFYREGDLISGNYVPNIPATITIQALGRLWFYRLPIIKKFSHTFIPMRALLK